MTQAVKELSKQQVIPKLSALFRCHRRYLEQQLAVMPQQFDPAINMVNETLQNMAARNVPSTDDDYVKQVRARDQLLVDRAAVVDKIHSQIVDLTLKEQDAVQKILNS
jgi:hypothetical protein